MVEGERKRPNRGCIIAAIIAGVVVVCGIVALIGGGVWLTNIGLDVVMRQVVNDIEDNPVILEHVGVIEKMEIDFTGSMAESGDDVFEFKIEGSKSNAVLVAKIITIDGEHEEVTWGRLTLPTGEKYDLIEGQGPKPK